VASTLAWIVLITAAVMHFRAISENTSLSVLAVTFGICLLPSLLLAGAGLMVLRQLPANEATRSDTNSRQTEASNE
jgi:hypothetical protein